MVHPICLSRLMLFYVPNQNQVTQQDAYVCAGLIILASFLNVLIGHQLMFRNLNLGMKMRVACCSLVYRKALRLSRGALIDTTVGQMVNLLSNDVNRFDYALTHLHNIWVAPVQVLVIMIIMYFLIDPVCLLGIAFLSLFIPFQSNMRRTRVIIHPSIKTHICFSLPQRINVKIQIQNSIENGRTSETDERNHLRNASDKDVRLGKVVREIGRTSQEVCESTQTYSGVTLRYLLGLVLEERSVKSKPLPTFVHCFSLSRCS